jgi:hypothetical protein
MKETYEFKVKVDSAAGIVRIDFPTFKPQHVLITVEEARALADDILTKLGLKRAA